MGEQKCQLLNVVLPKYYRGEITRTGAAILDSHESPAKDVVHTWNEEHNVPLLLKYSAECEWGEAKKATASLLLLILMILPFFSL